MKNIKALMVLFLLSNSLSLLGLSRATQSAQRIGTYAGYRAMPRISLPRTSSYYAAQRRFFTTGPENQKPAALVPVGSAQTASVPATNQTNQSLAVRVADWMRSWWGTSKTNEKPSFDADQELRRDMFDFVNKKMKMFEQQVLWDRSVIKDENDLLVNDMKAFAKDLKTKYGSVLTAEKDGYTIAANVLLLIREYFFTAMKNTALGDRLPLAYVFTACDLLRDLRKLGVVPSSNDALIIKNIVDAINTRLMDKLVMYNLSKEKLEQYLSEESVKKIIRASQLLVPIDEVFSLKQMREKIYNIESEDLNSTELNMLLKKMDLDKNKTMAELFIRLIFLKRLYGKIQFTATYSSEKEEYKQKIVDLDKTFEEIISMLSVTPEYNAFLKGLLNRVQNKYHTLEKELLEMRDEGYSAEKRGLDLEEFGRHVAKEDIKASRRNAEVRRWYGASKNVVRTEEKE